jgi:hypothetical protein
VEAVVLAAMKKKSSDNLTVIFIALPGLAGYLDGSRNQSPFRDDDPFEINFDSVKLESDSKHPKSLADDKNLIAPEKPQHQNPKRDIDILEID